MSVLPIIGLSFVHFRASGGRNVGVEENRECPDRTAQSSQGARRHFQMRRNVKKEEIGNQFVHFVVKKKINLLDYSACVCLLPYVS